MSTGTQAGGEPRPDFLARFLSVVPLLVLYFALAALYAWQASRRPVPTLFTDELELTQLARAIAHTGEPARRGVPYGGFASLVAYALAPVWWLGSSTASWAAAKLILVLAMTATIFPAYGLARMVVPKWYALGAAGAAVAVPALAYAPFLVEEPLAYPLATLALWLIARSLARPSWGRAAAAFAASAAAALTRTQLAVLFAVFALGLLWLAWDSETGRRWRSSWRTWDWVGFAILLVGVAVGFSALMGHLSTSWRETTGFFKDRVFDHGVWALGALSIGIGILPALLGIAALARPKNEPRTPETSRLRRHERRGTRRVRVVRGDQGRVPPERLLDRRRRAKRDLPRPDPLRIGGDGDRTRCRTRVGDRRGGSVHRLHRRKHAAPSQPVPVLRGARPLDRRLREPQARAGRKGRSKACSSPHASSRSSSSSR